MKKILPILVFFMLFPYALARDAFDRDDPSAEFTSNRPIKPGKYAGEQAQEVGRQVLDRVEAVNRHWLFTSKPEAENWSYRFRAQLLDGEKMEKEMKVDRGVSVWEKMRGITYFGLAQSLCSDRPDFKSVEVGKDQVRLHFLYTGKSVAAQRIGNGMDGQWFGFFQAEAKEGMLYVDAADYTVIGVKLPSGGSEKYTDYVALDETCKVPRRIEVEHPTKSDRMSFDLRFNAYEPGIWLFDRSEYQLNKKKRSAAMLADVKINGRPPVEITTPGRETKKKKR